MIIAQGTSRRIIHVEYKTELVYLVNVSVELTTIKSKVDTVKILHIIRADKVL